MKKPVYQHHLFINSGMAVTSFLSLEPANDIDEPVGYITLDEETE